MAGLAGWPGWVRRAAGIGLLAWWVAAVLPGWMDGTEPPSRSGVSGEAARLVAILRHLAWFPPGRPGSREGPWALADEAAAFDPDEGAWYVTVDGQPGVPEGWSGLLLWKERTLAQDRVRVWWLFRGMVPGSGLGDPIEIEGWFGEGPQGRRAVFGGGDGSWASRFWPAPQARRLARARKFSPG